MRLRNANEFVAEVASRTAQRCYLQIFGERVIHLSVAGEYFVADADIIQKRFACERIHPADEITQIAFHYEIRSLLHECSYRRRCAAACTTEHSSNAFSSEIGILLGSRESELFLDDFLREQEPRVLVSRPHYVSKRSKCVEPRIQRYWQPVAKCVEPQRRRTRQNSYSMHRPDGIPIRDSFHVVPHAIAIDEMRTRALADRNH